MCIYWAPQSTNSDNKRNARKSSRARRDRTPEVSLPLDALHDQSSSIISTNSLSYGVLHTRHTIAIGICAGKRNKKSIAKAITSMGKISVHSARFVITRKLKSTG